MKTFRLAFLLGILSTSLVGCNGGGNKCTVTFNGTNCFIRNGLDDKAQEFTTLKVDKNSSQTFQIFVKETDKYLVPEGSKVDTGDVKHEYYQSTDTAGHKEGQLVFPNIDHDVVITATARNRSAVTYEVEYPTYDTHTTWTGPTEIAAGEELVATVDVESPYILKKDYLYVTIGHVIYLDFTLENSKFTIPAAAITGKVVISGTAQRPAKGYNVELEVENAEKGTPFPVTMEENSSLYAVFTAKDGYRLPKIIDGDPSHDEFSIHRKGDSYDVALTPFDYQTFSGDFVYQIGSEEGKEYAEVYIIPGRVSGSHIKSIVFEGAAVKQVTVTFQVGEGHWEGGDTNPKLGTIDTGDTLENALKNACGGEIKTPVKDVEGWNFDEWKDEGGTPHYSPEEINEDLTVHATFKQTEYDIYIDSIYHATVTGLPTEPIHWHDPIGSALKPIKITAETGYKLPAANLVKVTMSQVGETTWIEIPFNYIRSSDEKEANFYISENVVEGDIKITLSAEKYVTVTFDPGEGKWKDKTQDKVSVTLPVGSTYGEALDLTGKGGNPTKDGLTFDSWRIDQTVIELHQIITAEVDGATITAYYTEIKTFANDTWANVIAHAEADDLVETYKDTIYIGATRTLDYNSKTYTVRLIDSDYDYYYKDGVATASALTFEFVDLINEDEYGIISGTSLGSNNWENSTYRTFLNGDFYTAITKENKGFVPKKAIKYTLSGQGETPLAMKETEDYFFPLSGAEIGLASQNNHAVNPTTYRDQQRENEGLAKGLAYYYYQNASVNRIKKLDGTATEYWLRSPHVYSDNESDPTHIDETDCYYIYKTGGTSQDYAGWQYTANASYSHGYMAAFCI